MSTRTLFLGKDVAVEYFKYVFVIAVSASTVFHSGRNLRDDISNPKPPAWIKNTRGK